ncbi:MAG: hypothetical protein LQ338_006422, partial [Usnochroma carphineum]
FEAYSLEVEAMCCRNTEAVLKSDSLKVLDMETLNHSDMHFHYVLPLVSALISAVTPSPIEARTCPSTNIIRDGGFESGVTPPTSGGNAWTVVDFRGASSYSLTSPGSTNSGGKYAFTASVYPGPYSPISGATLQQTMHTCAGKNYSITADIRFDQTQDNGCSISVQYPYKDTVGSVTTGSGTPGINPGVWDQTVSTFQAVSNADVLSIVFRCNGQNVHNLISVDNVKVQPFNGNAF